MDRIIKGLSLNRYLPFAVIVIALLIQSFLRNEDIGDVGLGSFNAIKVQIYVVNFLISKNAQKSQIGIGSFQQMINMKNPACVFIKDTSSRFLHVRWEIDSATNYAVFDNIEPDNRFEAIKNDRSFKLLYEVKRDNVWAAVFRRK